MKECSLALRLTLLVVWVLALGACRPKPSEETGDAGGPQSGGRPENSVIIGNQNRTDAPSQEAPAVGAGIDGDWLFVAPSPARDRDIGELMGAEARNDSVAAPIEGFFRSLAEDSIGGGFLEFVHPESRTVIGQQAEDWPGGQFDVRLAVPRFDGDYVSVPLKLRSELGFTAGEIVLERAGSGAWSVSALDIDLGNLDIPNRRDRFVPESYADVIPYL